ncbi:Ferric/cupric reductase transmembrane component 1 [Cyberlindnera fabianii]|uniref:Ferric/cupric reductase transmembrane component 1 n=1 Tax=Cyberlindnera fabianii TaxID=36022 RepID=A0A1V2L4E1_CYBFA|nr:Ferric/cupric reductase transmembrane component 1 [Cyberlindnera fabianii]
MRFSHLLLLLPTIVSASEYHHYSHAELVVNGCKTALSTVTAFCEKDSVKSYKCICKTPQGLGSLMNCVYNETVEYSSGVENMVLEYCNTKGKAKLTVEKLRDAYDNATEFGLVDIKKTEGYNKTNTAYVPVYYNTKTYKAAYESTYVRFKNVDWAMWMGSGLLGYWAVIFLIAVCYNVLNKTVFLPKYLSAHPINLIRKYITLPALVSKRHTHPLLIFRIIGGFIPTRLETLVLIGYFALNVAFSASGYVYVPNNTIWKIRDAQMSRYPGDRTGILCLFGFLLSFLFAGRNNFLLLLTGWKQSTFVTYHKWISRINFLLLVIHGGAMTVQSKSLGPGRYEARLQNDWMRWGIVACVAAAIIMVTAAYRVRKSHYEVFLACHIILVVFFLAGSWIHAADFGYQQFCYAMAAIWCFDRFVRLVRLAYFGVQSATVSVVSEEVLKLTVPRHTMWKAYPGAFGYLHYIRPTTFFQSHPFTIVETTDKTITFFTKIKGGVTSQIHQHLSAHPEKTAQINVSVEGPYGNQRNLHKFDTVLHYTGGTGIPTSYAYVLDSVKKGLKQHIKFYWVIRNWKSLDWFYEELSKLRQYENVECIIYITKPESEPGMKHLTSSSELSDGSDEHEKHTDGSSTEGKAVTAGMPPKGLDFIDFRYGRPNIDAIVESDIKECQGTCAILTAAHNSMVDDLRYAVSQNLDKSKNRVEYFEELQAW